MTDFNGHVHIKLIELEIFEVILESMTILENLKQKEFREDCMFHLLEVLDCLAQHPFTSVFLADST